jgi:hypothetical protein
MSASQHSKLVSNASIVQLGSLYIYGLMQPIALQSYDCCTSMIAIMMYSGSCVAVNIKPNKQQLINSACWSCLTHVSCNYLRQPSLLSHDVQSSRSSQKVLPVYDVLILFTSSTHPIKSSHALYTTVAILQIFTTTSAHLAHIAYGASMWLHKHCCNCYLYRFRHVDPLLLLLLLRSTTVGTSKAATASTSSDHINTDLKYAASCSIKTCLKCYFESLLGHQVAHCIYADTVKHLLQWQQQQQQWKCNSSTRYKVSGWQWCASSVNCRP